MRTKASTVKYIKAEAEERTYNTKRIQLLMDNMFNGDAVAYQVLRANCQHFVRLVLSELTGWGWDDAGRLDEFWDPKGWF